MVGWWCRSTTPGRGLKLFPCPEPLVTESSRRCHSQGREQRTTTASELASVFDAIDDGSLSSRKLPKTPCGHPSVSARYTARNGRRFHAQASEWSSDSGNTSRDDTTDALEAKRSSIRHHSSASEDLENTLALQARRPSSAEASSLSSVRRVFAKRSSICPASLAADVTKSIDRPLESFAKADVSQLPTRRDFAKRSEMPADIGDASARIEEALSQTTRLPDQHKECLPLLPSPNFNVMQWPSHEIADYLCAAQSYSSTRHPEDVLERIPSSFSRSEPPRDSKNAITSVEEGAKHSCSEVVKNSEALEYCIAGTWPFDHEPQDNDKDSSKTYSPIVPLNGRPSFSRSLSQCSTCEEWEPMQCSSVSGKCTSSIGPAFVPPATELLPFTTVKREIDEELVDLRNQLEDATKKAEALRSRINATKMAGELEAAELRSRRQVATDALKDLVGLPLAEIKRMANAPPESIRRTLAATWVLLHCDRYSSKSVVSFDDVRDWSKVQRMLTKDSFVAQVANFSPEKLDKYPRVINYLFKVFFGDNVDTCSADKSSSRPSSRRTRPSSRQSSKSQVSAGTSLEAVSRASQPCGSLARWIIALLVERQALRKQSDSDNGLADMTSELDAAEHRCVELARAISCAHAAKLAECAKQRAAFAINEEVVQGSISPKKCTPVQLLARPKTAPPMEVPRLQSRELPIREVIRRKVHGIEC